MTLENPFTQFCQPAQFFLLFIVLDLFYIVFLKKLKKTFTMGTKIKIFLIFCLGGLGWSFVVNYACGYEKYVAWVLAAIPLLYLTFK